MQGQDLVDKQQSVRGSWRLWEIGDTRVCLCCPRQQRHQEDEMNYDGIWWRWNMVEYRGAEMEMEYGGTWCGAKIKYDEISTTGSLRYDGIWWDEKIKYEDGYDGQFTIRTNAELYRLSLGWQLWLGELNPFINKLVVYWKDPLVHHP